MVQNAQNSNSNPMLYNADFSQDSCGVGFITRKDSQQTHDVLVKSHEALCTIPHRGGMSAEGIGDGAGVNIDLSLNFFRKIIGNTSLALGEFGVANFFFPEDHAHHDSTATRLVENHFAEFGLPILKWREIPVDNTAINAAAVKAQLPIKQVIFGRPDSLKNATHEAFERHIQSALLTIEVDGYTRPELKGFYPLSMSSRTQVYKGRLNSFEVIPYFVDLYDEDHEISTLFFHTRFSTNTAPATMMAQPFRYMAHNGELNTDKKNRLSENAIARQNNKHIVFPMGQSDSGRLDQTLTRRINEDGLDIVTAILAMMPPAWENDPTLPEDVRAMLEYFSLYEEKNDGPAALIFNDGIRVGARLDRLGLRPLRSIETHDYLAVMSEAGQIDFPADQVLKRGRIEAGGMLYFDHETGQSYDSHQVLIKLAAEKDYKKLLADSCVHISSLPAISFDSLCNSHELSIEQRHTAYSLNQESFKFLLDPILQSGLEKVTAMGYGLTPNALSSSEGGMSKYFSQRFAQVTNPPLDSLRESDGMTLRVALGAKPTFAPKHSKQLMLETPILKRTQIEQIRLQTQVESTTIDMVYTPDFSDALRNEKLLEDQIAIVCAKIEAAASNNKGIIILSDAAISNSHAAIPALLMVAAANQHLVKNGLRFNSSIVVETGQISSPHDIATLLGFGASAICPLSVHNRVLTEYSDTESREKALYNFQKGIEKSLMKTMGKFGLCTVESYIGGEFFESNYLDTDEPKLKPYFPNIHSSVGGVRYADIASSAAEWHQKSLTIQSENDIPFLGLFKERQDGAGHTFGNTAVREYISMTDEPVLYIRDKSPIASDTAYLDFGYEKRSPQQIDNFGITPAYRSFTQNLELERTQRPAALRDVMAFPADVTNVESLENIANILGSQDLEGNSTFLVRGLKIYTTEEAVFKIAFSEKNSAARLSALDSYLKQRFVADDFKTSLEFDGITVMIYDNTSPIYRYLSNIQSARQPIELAKVQPAHEITPTFASGAMSHGALLGEAHEAVAQGTNIAGAMSNSGEGGEHSSRFGTIRSSKIKQFASGRFGVWAGYLADPNLEEIEIKIGQGAKPGEGGQLPAPKVSVEIAALRGGTPKVELVSPPPHHDTYSIEDLGQLIHDAKAARVKVIVKLVSSEGIGTIAVGVAKAGADVINVAGNTGGTGAAAVTSLKNTGRSPEIGIAEVHQALAVNGLREKVTLRCSAAHQNGADVVKSAILGGDSFEFGTTALMMLRCVMAKNCNIRCPAGLTTSHEEFKGDPRILAQYFMNLAHEVREILASLGYTSLKEIRGKTELLHLIKHPNMVGQIQLQKLLAKVEEIRIEQPVYLEKDFSIDDNFLAVIKKDLFSGKQKSVLIEGKDYKLNNRHKTVGGQVSIDLERALNYELSDKQRSDMGIVHTNQHGRHYLADNTITIRTHGSAGQSYGAFNNDGIRMEHTGTCNDGVAKTACGGIVIIKSPGGGSEASGENVLIGNFALFGASGGKVFINGEAGDRFAVRNSGAMAVVEGVGDFACEYMINGTVLNLGGFGKGFCTGMSGGNAYQYDPSNQLEALYDKTSVSIHRINDNSELAQTHESFILYMLEQHFEYTGSIKAKFLLDNWSSERAHFKFALPLWLNRTQTAEYLSKSMDRKAMIEELSVDFAQSQICQIKRSLTSGTSLFNGSIPNYGSQGSDLIHHLVNSYAVIDKAQQIAKDQLQKSGMEITQSSIDHYAEKLILERPRKLQDALVKNIREAFSEYNDSQLADLMANKRLNDYKETLKLRDVQSIYSIGSTSWIIEQDHKNRIALEGLSSIDANLAMIESQQIAQSMLD